MAITEEFTPVRDIDRINKYAPEKLIGREEEMQLLSGAWAKAVRGETPRPHILTFVALGGEGKTALLSKWAAELANNGWPGCAAVYAWSFYSQGTREQTTASSDMFMKDALTFFGDPEMANSAQSAYEKGRRLAQLVSTQRALLILDGLEPLQYAPTAPTAGELKDPGLAALLKRLAIDNRGLCVVTTRYAIADLRAYWEGTAPQVELERLPKEAGMALLKQLGVQGNQQLIEKLVEDVHGHALTLNLLGAYLHEAHSGDIRKRDLVKLEEASEELGGHAFRVIDAYVKWFEGDGEEGQHALAVLQLLGLFDRPASADCLAALLQPPAIPLLTTALVGLNESQRNRIFTRLKSAKLIIVNRDASGALLSLDAHPLLRAYFSKQLREDHYPTYKAAHRIIFRHLCDTTKEGDRPTLDDLQPLFLAVAHGCQAGMQRDSFEKIYHNRIQRGTRGSGFYSTSKLGAFASSLGAVACFFDTPWNRVAPTLPEDVQAWLFNAVAFYLRALGRLHEALDPIRIGIEILIKRKDWINVARSICNLSELKMLLGAISDALSDAEQSVTYADLSDDSFRRMITRVCVANTLHQMGHREEAEKYFREAERIQAIDQPNNPQLYSLGGFLYCDLLLAVVEGIAWQRTLNGSPSLQPSSFQNIYYDVVQSATISMDIAKNNDWLHEIALHHLTLGQAAFFQALTEGTSLTTKCHAPIGTAVDVLRRAGTQDYLPRGLLTRAWLRYVDGDLVGAQEDLDEAWEIAERGPMPLHQADIHLYRARLFGGRTDADGKVLPYPWESPHADLAEARLLIEKHGYWRRKEELEDAEAAAKNWPNYVEGKPEMTVPKVFISYSHDSDAHRAQVLAFSERLRADGIDTILDRYVPGTPPEGWPRWMMNGLDAATYVVCVCTETYYRRFRGQEVPGKGKGGDWEGALITQALYDARSSTNKFIPVLLTRADEPYIPEPLRPQTYYVLDSESGYQDLYDMLLDQAGVEPGAIGKLKPKPRATARPATFGVCATAPAPPMPVTASPALQTWLEKLDFLQQQEAIASDAAQKFTLSKQIKEAKATIAELQK